MMDFEKIKKNLGEAYTAVQNLHIQPTKGNIEMLNLIMTSLDEAFGMVEEGRIEAEAEATAGEEKKEEE